MLHRGSSNGRSGLELQSNHSRIEVRPSNLSPFKFSTHCLFFSPTTQVYHIGDPCISCFSNSSLPVGLLLIFVNSMWLFEVPFLVVISSSGSWLFLTFSWLSWECGNWWSGRRPSRCKLFRNMQWISIVFTVVSICTWRPLFVVRVFPFPRYSGSAVLYSIWLNPSESPRKRFPPSDARRTRSLAVVPHRGHVWEIVPQAYLLQCGFQFRNYC